MKTTTLLTFLILNAAVQCLIAQDLPVHLPEIKYHLTASPWKELHISKDAYLDAIEGMAKVAATFQDETGAIIDPFLHREHQYSTPYFAVAVGCLISQGRTPELIEPGVMAMEKSLRDFADGNLSIPDQHGEFYIAALSEAMPLYKNFVTTERYAQWESKIRTPLAKVWKGPDKGLNNWRTYAMRGEWSRARHGFIETESAITFVEDQWKNYTQRERIALDKWNLYQDWSSDPQSHAVDAVGRVNLTAMALDGYSGPSGEEMRTMLRKAGEVSMLLQSPAGQCPPNGRTDNHVFNDILYQLIFEMLAEDALASGNQYLAGQYRRSALLAFSGIQRWQRSDDTWAGSYSIAKNHFEQGDRTGYQPASQWGNYTGAMMMHLAECFLVQKSEISQVPAPTEIGGYTLKTDDRFSTFVANAGGMQVFINLRGASVPKYDKYWTPLGTVRFSKVNWDDRLGPSDGQTKDISMNQDGISFGPVWQQNNKWVRLADMARDYEGTVTTLLVHPLLVRFRVTYTYVTGSGGPYFHQEFIVTPDGVLTILSSPDQSQFGLTVPLLINDGRELDFKITSETASTGYFNSGDRENFIAINKVVEIKTDGEAIRSTYGDLLPVRFETPDERLMVFVYPQGGGDPDANEVREKFEIAEDGFSSILGKVDGNMYYGRHSAGGYGEKLDLNSDGNAELTFSKPCGFIARIVDGKIRAVETDAEVQMRFGGNDFLLQAYTPLEFE